MILTSRSRANPRCHLAVEFLETREGPSSVTGVPGLDVVGQLPVPVPGEPGQVQGTNKAPTITDFKAVVGPNGQVTFTGKVSDDQPVGGDLVRITGPGVDLSAIVRDDGTFQVTTTVFAIGQITVAARATDALGATSDPVYTTFGP
jgi:hypothetical protein